MKLLAEEQREQTSPSRLAPILKPHSTTPHTAPNLHCTAPAAGSHHPPSHNILTIPTTSLSPFPPNLTKTIDPTQTPSPHSTPHTTKPKCNTSCQPPIVQKAAILNRATPEKSRPFLLPILNLPSIMNSRLDPSMNPKNHLKEKPTPTNMFISRKDTVPPRPKIRTTKVRRSPNPLTTCPIRTTPDIYLKPPHDINNLKKTNQPQTCKTASEHNKKVTEDSGNILTEEV